MEKTKEVVFELDNVYKKLMKCRIDLQKYDIKKSGFNKYAGYAYYELQDFLPKINELFYTHGLIGIIKFSTEFATLTIINSDKVEEVISFCSPMSSAELKGCHDIQNVGAVETYQRRYLYMVALEITESDALDGTVNKPEKAKKPKVNNYPVNEADKKNPATKKQRDFIEALLSKRGVEKEKRASTLSEFLKRVVSQEHPLSFAEASLCIENFKTPTKPAQNEPDIEHFKRPDDEPDDPAQDEPDDDGHKWEAPKPEYNGWPDDEKVEEGDLPFGRE
jgi:hypothetical protein